MKKGRVRKRERENEREWKRVRESERKREKATPSSMENYSNSPATEVGLPSSHPNSGTIHLTPCAALPLACPALPQLSPGLPQLCPRCPPTLSLSTTAGSFHCSHQWAPDWPISSRPQEVFKMTSPHHCHHRSLCTHQVGRYVCVCVCGGVSS